jgi:ATP-dependent RNA helicase SUPV3L1/SUV3
MTIVALLGPTNTGKTHRAIERLLEHRTGAIGLPLRLLAREVYDRITAQIGERAVALVTGEEKRVPDRPRYWVCTVESLPRELDVEFVAIDEIQLATHPQRGHTFTQMLLAARGARETWFLGSHSMAPMVEQLLPTARILRHPRLSQLHHLGTLSLGALPPRTALVAFSVADVYEIAERVRQRHGGTAVVTGSLSPRTRNAQVAMYQAGEVHYMVATDAIGMGLNLDVDRVVFAARSKFDGADHRPLDLQELAQIAGRAGRHTSNGGFATLRSVPPLPPGIVDAIERHELPPVTQLVWRNDALDFTSIDALLASLRERPRRAGLRIIEQADDHDALVQLARLPGVRQRVTTPADVELLWDVCRIPDYRKLLLDSHVQLLAELFEQLSGPDRRIDAAWLRSRLSRLDSTEGDIDALTQRIAFVRTWTYVTHQEQWVADAMQWQERARQIEDRCSDALHQRLTERFVERHATAGARPVRARRPVTGPHEPVPAEGLAADHPFAVLQTLSVPRGPESATGAERDVEVLVEAPHDAFGWNERLELCHGPLRLARLVRGSDLLHPELRGVTDDWGAGAASRISRRLRAWIVDETAELMGPLTAIDTSAMGGSARGLVYQTGRGLGTLDGRAAADQIAGLRPADRRALERAGLAIGPAAVHCRAMLSPRLVRLRAALWIAWHEPAALPGVPDVGKTAIAIDAATDPDYWLHVGFVPLGARAVRGDRLAAIEASTFAAARDGDDDALRRLSALLGLRMREVEAALPSLP